MLCSKCNEEMRIAYENKNQILWKCRNRDCGHMVLVQEWDRDDVLVFTKERKHGKNRYSNNK